MRIDIIEKKVYQITDLKTNEQLKENVLSKNRYTNVSHDWAEHTIECFKELCNCMGLDIEKVYFSGFHSQGDGACFIGKYSYNKNSVSLLKTITKDETIIKIAKQLSYFQRKSFYSVHAKITHTGRYCHENSMSYDFYSDRTENIEEHLFEKQFQSLAKWLYNKLDESYEYLISDEAVLETLIMENYEFSEDGSIY
jgi:hypothetical protein